jgi:hypothetical protein
VKRKILMMTVVLLAIAMLATPLPYACATKPKEANQQMILQIGGMPSPYMSARPLGESGNMIVYWTDLPVVFSGTISGTGVYNGETVVKSDGTAIGHAVITLNAEVEGITGVLTITWCQGGWTIISSNGELEGLHGTGTATIDEAIPIIYYLNGQIHLDPQ